MATRTITAVLLFEGHINFAFGGQNLWDSTNLPYDSLPRKPCYHSNKGTPFNLVTNIPASYLVLMSLVRLVIHDMIFYKGNHVTMTPKTYW